jgi:hypothetical protein
MLLAPRRGAWLIPQVLASTVSRPPVVVPLPNPPAPPDPIAIEEVISGYSDHQTELSGFPSGLLRDAMFHIHRVSDEFVTRFGTSEPVREIMVIGHSDRVWTGGGANTADEVATSQRRADDVWNALARDIIMNPKGFFTGRQLLVEVNSGSLRVTVVGIGARRRIKESNRGPAPENRRVVIQLWLVQATPI